MCTRSEWVVVEAHWWIYQRSSAWYSCINNRTKLWKQIKSFVDFRKAVSARLRLLNLYGNNLHVTTCSRITSFLSNEPETSNVLLHKIRDFDDKRVALDEKQIKIIKDLQSFTVILKLDKGEGVVLIPKQDYTDSLFSNRTKFKPNKTDPTQRRLNSIQN